MGSGATNESKCVKPQTIFSKLEGFLEDLEEHIYDFENEKFRSLNEFKNSKNKILIEDLQKLSGEELYQLRIILSKISSKSDLEKKNLKLNACENKLQNLYMKFSEITIDKIQMIE